jgi:hypothetical protein
MCTAGGKEEIVTAALQEVGLARREQERLGIGGAATGGKRDQQQYATRHVTSDSWR